MSLVLVQWRPEGDLGCLRNGSETGYIHSLRYITCTEMRKITSTEHFVNLTAQRWTVEDSREFVGL